MYGIYVLLMSPCSKHSPWKKINSFTVKFLLSKQSNLPRAVFNLYSYHELAKFSSQVLYNSNILPYTLKFLLGISYMTFCGVKLLVHVLTLHQPSNCLLLGYSASFSVHECVLCMWCMIKIMVICFVCYAPNIKSVQLLISQHL